MPENQNIEWKESWRDEYLKWICGFANAQGGKIYIGKNDKGEVVGVDNALISNAFFRSGYIEAWGRGTINMINECTKRNIPKPKYRYDFSGVIIEFENKVFSYDGVNDGVNDGVLRFVDESIDNGIIDNLKEDVKNEIITIINIVANNEGVNTNGIVSRLGNKSKPTVERYLKVARNIKAIKYIGAAKTGGYFITKRLKDLLKQSR